MRECRSDQKSSGAGTPALPRLVVLLAVTSLLSACEAPVAVAPNLRGTYWSHALVTNPNGGGPQIVRWGPPDPFFPLSD